MVLGICYGLQHIVQRLGGEVRVGEKQEYGRMEIGLLKSLSAQWCGSGFVGCGFVSFADLGLWICGGLVH